MHAAGAGVLCFVGGGVGIFSGVVWTGNLGAYNHFGTGFNLFNGGKCSVPCLRVDVYMHTK